MKVTFDQDGWEDYCYWQTEDRRTLRRINQLIADIARNGNTGMGKPERLSGDLSRYWSRRIDHQHRLVYRIGNAGEILIAACRFHYGDH